eukprot:scaffold5085_cov115-Cylindrotheca_fusiformis.AAC.5
MTKTRHENVTVQKPDEEAPSSGMQIGKRPNARSTHRPLSLILVWVLVASELALDLVTSGIAFAAFLSESRDCCGVKINSGILPLGSTIPFFFLVVAELIFLLRAILLTVWPRAAMNEEESMDGEGEKKGCYRGRWTPNFMVWIVNFLTIVNPFFGFAIAWMLLYLSDKQEALIVMGLETATVILHFLCIYLENAAKTVLAKLMHSIIIIPWLATVAVNVWYLNQGGVCYDTVLETFWYRGCEICPNGMRPVNGTLCPTTTLVDGVNQTTYETFKLWEMDSTSSCGGDNDVCWFSY